MTRRLNVSWLQNRNVWVDHYKLDFVSCISTENAPTCLVPNTYIFTGKMIEHEACTVFKLEMTKKYGK